MSVKLWFIDRLRLTYPPFNHVDFYSYWHLYSLHIVIGFMKTFHQAYHSRHSHLSYLFFLYPHPPTNTVSFHRSLISALISFTNNNIKNDLVHLYAIWDPHTRENMIFIFLNLAYFIWCDDFYLLPLPGNIITLLFSRLNNT